MVNAKTDNTFMLTEVHEDGIPVDLLFHSDRLCDERDAVAASQHHGLYQGFCFVVSRSPVHNKIGTCPAFRFVVFHYKFIRSDGL